MERPQLCRLKAILVHETLHYAVIFLHALLYKFISFSNTAKASITLLHPGCKLYCIYSSLFYINCLLVLFRCQPRKAKRRVVAVVIRFAALLSRILNITFFSSYNATSITPPIASNTDFTPT